MPDPAPPTPPGTITLCDIVAVLIRILAIKLGMSNVSALLTVTARRPVVSWSGAVIELLALAIILLFVYWLWQLSSFLARHITRGRNSVLPASAFDLPDLYSFAFVFVGLNCIVDGAVPLLTQLYYAVMQASSAGALTPEQKANFYTVFNSAISLIIGIGLTSKARKLATKLLKRQDGATPAQHAAVK